MIPALSTTLAFSATVPALIRVAVNEHSLEIRHIETSQTAMIDKLKHHKLQVSISANLKENKATMTLVDIVQQSTHALNRNCTAINVYL